MHPLTQAAARALAAGDPLAALKRVALRDDAPALALRGIAMAQLGELARARDLLRRAARRFGPNQAVACARCVVAEAEIALVSRDLGTPMRALGAARAELTLRGDRVNAAHAGYLEARRLLLLGRVDQSERTLNAIDFDVLPRASQTGYWLVSAGIAMRRVRAAPARAALARARHTAHKTGIAALAAEVELVSAALDACTTRLIAGYRQCLIGLAEVEALFASDTLVVDACRNLVRAGTTVVSLAGRPVLFALARALAEVSPEDVSRETLIARAFRGRDVDESHRARLRVEVGRLREMLRPLARLSASRRGYRLQPHSAQSVAVLAPAVEGDHADVLALLADGETWSSSALALALNVSPRTIQRALEALADGDKVKSFGRGRACRWMVPRVPDFPTSLLLPGPLMDA